MTEYVNWVYEHKLACASRPGYSSENVSLEDMQNWLGKVKEMQVRSIICLLTEEQLAYYRGISGGLLAHYRTLGYEVVNIPITDPADSDEGWTELNEALGEIYARYQALPKPVLIHCSAGRDRTGKAVSYIQEQEDQKRK